MKTALTIAGSDCSGGAGIQADLKTMTLHGVYAMSAITALTAQNTTGVTGIVEVPPEFLQQQLDMVFTDIRPHAVKIGMVPNAVQMEVIARCLQTYGAEQVVLDPVMVATSGSSLMRQEAISVLKAKLMPRVTLVTPNAFEAQALSGVEIGSKADMLRAAERIAAEYGCAVLLKGGHSAGDADDLLYAGGRIKWFRGKRIDNPNTHGTGCTLSSAIVANLAKGYDLEWAVERAKEYVSGAIGAMLNLGRGQGPMCHSFDLHSRFAEEK